MSGGNRMVTGAEYAANQMSKLDNLEASCASHGVDTEHFALVKSWWGTVQAPGDIKTSSQPLSAVAKEYSLRKETDSTQPSDWDNETTRDRVTDAFSEAKLCDLFLHAMRRQMASQGITEPIRGEWRNETFMIVSDRNSNATAGEAPTVDSPLKTETLEGSETMSTEEVPRPISGEQSKDAASQDPSE